MQADKQMQLLLALAMTAATTAGLQLDELQGQALRLHCQADSQDLLHPERFVCEATHLPSVRSQPAGIDVLWMSEASLPMQLPEWPASRLEMRCWLDYRWFRNEERQKPEQRVRARRDLLLIDETARALLHQIDYSCVDVNAVGQSSISLRLLVGYPLEFRKPLAPRSQQPISLSCGSSPMPALSSKVSYTCEVTRHGLRTVRSVSPNLKFSPQPVDRRLELHTSAKLSCRAQGSEAPTVRWQREDAPLGGHVLESNGSLVFENVSREDAGNYTCVASNAQGRIQHTIRVEVVVGPRFATEPSNVTAQEGESALLQCSAQGQPRPAVHWDREARVDGLRLGGRLEQLANDSLLIRQLRPDDEGTYGCTAGNSGGLVRRTLYLRVLAVGDEGPPPERAAMTSTVLLTLGAAAAYMMLVVGLMLYCRWRRRRRKLRRPVTPPQDEQQRARVGGRDPPAVVRAQLQRLKPLGRGEFGEVFSASYPPLGPDPVMVKSLSAGRDEGAMQELQRHLDLLRGLEHENVAGLLGLCREEEPHYLLLQYTDWGDLKQFLLASAAREGPSGAPQLDLPQMISLASQAALGLQFLSERRLVHRDVAARNCLVSSRLTLKLSLACLSKQPYQQEYCRHRDQLMPLRWMPAEAVFEDEFSCKSDAYAYAVLVWELFHRGELPQRRLSDEALLARLREGGLTWRAPDEAPPALQSLLARCWSADPRERPSFDELSEQLRLLTAD